MTTMLGVAFDLEINGWRRWMFINGRLYGVVAV